MNPMDQTDFPCPRCLLRANESGRMSINHFDERNDLIIMIISFPSERKKQGFDEIRSKSPE
jgi:hypothetical protein